MANTYSLGDEALDGSLLTLHRALVGLVFVVLGVELVAVLDEEVEVLLEERLEREVEAMEVEAGRRLVLDRVLELPQEGADEV